MEQSEVREIQACCLTILEEIDRICKKNHIQYFLSCGTALGCVRHQGFIPWDDDLDITMTRDQYDLFIEALKKDLGDDFYFHCFETDTRYNVLIPSMKIRKKNTYIQEVNTLLKNKCDGDGLFVDVFVYDHVSNSKIINFFMRLWMYLLALPIFVFDNLGVNLVPIKRLFVGSDRFFGRLNRHSKRYGLSYTWLFCKPNRQLIFDKDILFPLIEMPFEGKMYPMPHDPHRFLSIAIAPDYMTPPPENQRIAKHTVAFSTTKDHA